MAIILNIETATDICSICISKKDEVLIMKEDTKGFSHAAEITLLIEKSFSESGLSINQIDAVAVSKGPGSYTSLRVGASTAKGICYALDRPMIAVDTLYSIAAASIANNKQKALYAPMIDARRMEVYTAIYDFKKNIVQDTNAKIIDENAFREYFEKGQTIIFSGNGAAKCQNVIKSPFAKFSNEICSASNLVPIAFEAFQRQDFCDVAYFSPFYFKSPNITIPRKTL